MDTNSRKLLLKDEVFQIVGCAIEVLNTLGHGLIEKPYENALVVEFLLRKIPFQQQPSFAVQYKAHKVGLFVPDLIAFGSVVVDTTFDQAIAERNRLQALDPFPNDENYRKLQGYLERYTDALDKFKDDLKTEQAPEQELAPNEFQSRLRQATLAAEDRARTNNVNLPDKFQLGFDEFARTMPGMAVAPLLGQELSQVQMLINILLDAKVDSITSFRRRPLPEERGSSATPTPTPPAGQRGVAATRPGATLALKL